MIIGLTQGRLSTKYIYFCKNKSEWTLNLSFRDETQEESYEPSYDAREGRYEGYRERDLPEGYAPYGQTGNADTDYDRYQEYDQAEYEPIGPKRGLCKRLKSCCSDMGKTKHIRQESQDLSQDHDYRITTKM